MVHLKISRDYQNRTEIIWDLDFNASVMANKTRKKGVVELIAKFEPEDIIKFGLMIST